MRKNEWFESWFDTPYYHLLYKNRDLSEAQKFIERLVNELKIPANSFALDLACGKGRHSLTLANCGLKVLGVDLSPQSITSAKEFSCEKLEFEVHDMRKVIQDRKFDYIFNLFTSFGYFDDEAENLRVFHCIHQMLKKEGIFVFDFLNLKTTLASLVPSETKIIEGVEFQISKELIDGSIRKSIDINDNGKVYHFEEKVKAYSYSHLRKMLSKADFEILDVFGNFNLHKFNESTADRAIFICKRKQA